MSHFIDTGGLKLDPWTASSLLQKAIRRGEVHFAQQAAAAFYRMRGNAIWRRLMGIALEDVGLGDPDLVWEATQLATDKKLRGSYGPDSEQIVAMCAKLAAAPKDRSVDYLYCSATRLPTALQDRAVFDDASFEHRLDLAVDDFQPLARRAAAALSLCARLKADRQVMSEPAVLDLIAALRMPRSHPLAQTVLTLALEASHPYSLMLPLLWSQWDFTGGSVGVAHYPLPGTEYVGGVPLYAFDKHTAVGKKAISQLSEQSSSVRAVLERLVPRGSWTGATLMAAFYADAAPVARRLKWFADELLEHVGFKADMLWAGCPMEGAVPLLTSVQDNLNLLNQLRRTALVQGRQQPLCN